MSKRTYTKSGGLNVLLVLLLLVIMNIVTASIYSTRVSIKKLDTLENDLISAMQSGKYIEYNNDTIVIKDSYFSPSSNIYSGVANMEFRDKGLKERAVTYSKMQDIEVLLRLVIFGLIVLMAYIGFIMYRIAGSAKASISTRLDYSDDTDIKVISRHKEASNIKVINNDGSITHVKYPMLNDVKGMSEIIEEVNQIVDFLKNKDKYIQLGARLPKGIILYGPPGTGKTMLAKAMANEANIEFIYASGSSFINKYVGVGASNVRKVFKQAKDSAPCILFIDEIDAIGGKRNDDTNNEYLSTLEALLVELDGFDSRDGIFVIAATNRLDSLDEALIRPGRFDKSIAVPLPDYKGRLEILQGYCKGKNLSEDINLELIAKQTQGLSGAYLETIVNEAIILAVKNNRDYITQKDLMEAIYTILLKGKMRKREDQDELERKTIAYHEAGHALISKLIIGEEVSKVTIIGSTSGAGGVTFSVPKNISLHSKQDLINQVMKLYAGRAAEEILRGRDNITIGASNDIERATELIYQMITVYGLNDEIGLLNLHKFRQGLTDETIEEMKKLSKEIYDNTVQFLNDNIELLEILANELLEKETLLDSDINELLYKEAVVV